MLRYFLLPAALGMAVAACADSGIDISAAGRHSPAAGRYVGGSQAGGAAPRAIGAAQAVVARMTGRASPNLAGFASLPDRGNLVGYPADRVVRREGPHTWHRADISEIHALRAIAGGVLSLTTPSGDVLRYAYDRRVEHESGDWTWIGHAVGGGLAEDIVLTFGKGAVFGTAHRKGTGGLRIAMRDGVTWIVETDAALQAARADAAGLHAVPDFRIPADSADTEASTNSTATVVSAQPTSVSTMVDVVIGYTGGFQAANSIGPGGNISNVGTRLNHLVDVTNEAYVNSQVSLEVRLVHSMRVEYPDNTANDEALFDLTGSEGTNPNPALVPAALQPLRSAREQYGADLVVLIRDFNYPENSGCGVAWLNGGGMQVIGAWDEDFGFSVVSDGQDDSFFCAETTFAHELGHNMGLAHDVETARGDDGVLDQDEYGRFAYSFGYRTGPAQGHFKTVMAYADDQVNAYNVFSNPMITACGGFACGLSGQAENARTLASTAPIVATFRAQTVPTEEVPEPLGLAGDIDGDGTDDLLWFNPSTRELYYWLIEDGGVVLGRGGVLAPPNTTPRALGDFNADGRADILLPSGHDIWIYFGSANGGFTSGYLATYPAGWDLLGSRDVDADGTHDVLWHHPSTGELYYWIINAGVVKLGRGGVAAPPNAAPTALGDFNGDSRADIVLASTQDIWIYFGQPSGSFVSAYLAPNPSGWELVGSENLDDDGKTDLLWHHPASRGLYSWLMNGSTIMAGIAGPPAPPNTTPSAFADFNGDGRADVVLPSSTDIWTYLTTSPGSFTSVYTAPYPAGWQ